MTGVLTSGHRQARIAGAGASRSEFGGVAMMAAGMPFAGGQDRFGAFRARRLLRGTTGKPPSLDFVFLPLRVPVPVMNSLGCRRALATQAAEPDVTLH